MDRKFASMDKLHSQEETERFLRGLGLKLQEEKVRIVVETLQGKTSRSKYDLWAYGKSRGGGERHPVCGKGTVVKIEHMYKEGRLEPYVAYLDAAEAGIEELERQRATHDKENAAVSGDEAQKVLQIDHGLQIGGDEISFGLSRTAEKNHGRSNSASPTGAATGLTAVTSTLLRTIPDEWPEGYLCTTKDTLHGKAAMRWTTARPQQAGDEFTLNLGQEVSLKAIRFLQGRQGQWDCPKRWKMTISNNQQIIEEVEGEGFIQVERKGSTPVQWIGVVIVEPRLPTDQPPATCWAVDNIELELGSEPL